MPELFTDETVDVAEPIIYKPRSKTTEFFDEVRKARMKLTNVEERRDYYRLMASDISACTEQEIRAKGGLPTSRTESAALKLIRLSEEVEKVGEAYYELIRQANELIEKLDDPRYQSILTWRYVMALSWDEIVARTGDTKDALFARNGRALKAVSKWVSEWVTK